MTFTIHIKRSSLLLLFCCLFACNNSDTPISNNQTVNFNFNRDFIDVMTDFTVDTSINKSDDVTDTFYHFKSAQPVSKDETGNYYYRWTLSISTFTNHSMATIAFEERVNEYRKTEDLMENKGDNSSQIIVKNKIYKLSASCLEGYHQKEWFEQLQKVIIGDNKPDRNTVLISNCGGTWKLL